MTTELDDYQTPIRKLTHKFKVSRDLWKEKCQTAKLQLKRLQTRVADLIASRTFWKNRCHQAEFELKQLRTQLQEQKCYEQKNLAPK